jgi:hypothetical protein
MKMKMNEGHDFPQTFQADNIRESAMIEGIKTASGKTFCLEQ